VARAKNGLPDDDLALFREAVRGAIPLESPLREPLGANLPPPIPVQSLLDAHAALAESLDGPVSLDQFTETGEEFLFLRDGLGRDVLRKLRRGHWVVQNAVDLHGLNREQARLQLAHFLGACLKRGLRCVRVIHGKGLRSPKREPVLKAKVRQWLMQRDEVLAFCQAPAALGGSGALLVLLGAGTRS
jgi:DNA-nicking Smr family endonuclease